MIEITITGKVAPGKALLYEKLGRQGKRKFVPTYEAFAHCSITGKQFSFTVTRDSSAHVFGEQPPEDRYGTNGECPPCANTPYIGSVREDAKKGFRIVFFEPEHREVMGLVGRGTTLRKEMLIHFGAAASFGCIMVAGWRRYYDRVFANPIKRMLVHTDYIQVIVEPRD